MGCRKYKGHQYFDDLTGQTHLPEELESFAFVFDGEALEIDLTDENAAAFREAMAPFVKAARRTTKSRVMATLPRRKRHLHAVPDVPPSPEPLQAPENAPSEEKGDDAEALPDSEGTQVPEEAPSALNSSAPEPAPRPALSIVSRPPMEPIPEQWVAYKPERRDDMADRRLKARQWAGAMAMQLPDNKVTDEILKRWEGFYRERRWTLMT